MKPPGIGDGGGTSTVEVVDSSNEAAPAPEYASSISLYIDAGLSSDDEECSLDPQLAASLGIVLADCENIQIRITRSSGESAIFTVMALTQAATDSYIGLTAGGFAKLDSVATTLSGCSVSTRVTWPGYTAVEAAAHAEGLYIERVRDDGSSVLCIALAPHGGLIESGTDEQADAFAAALGCSSWVCEGYSVAYPTGGHATQSAAAYARFHITSTAISGRSFPLLGTLLERGFEYSVAFHGLSDATAAALGGGDCDVLIGGSAALQLREDIATAVNAITGFTAGGFTSRAAVVGDAPFAGTESSNICNAITGTSTNGVFVSSNAGLQIEQSTSARAAFAEEIALAIAVVIAAQ